MQGIAMDDKTGEAFYSNVEDHVTIVPSSGIVPADVAELLLAASCPSADDCGRLIWSAYTDGADAIRRTQDARWVGTIGQTREVLKRLFADGVQDDTEYQSFGAGATRTVNFGDDTQLVMGAVIEWGVERQLSQPFTLEIETTGWIASSDRLRWNSILAPGTSVNRKFALRICSGINGGLIYFPFGERVQPSMELMQPVVAVPMPNIGMLPQSTISVTNIPAGLQPTFNMDVKLMTAFSIATSQWARRIGLFDGKPRKADICTLR